MGAAIAVGVAGRAAAEPGLASPWGLVLLAPMLAPAASMFAVHLASVLAYTPLAPLALIPSSATSNEKQYADPEIVKEVENDPLAYKGNLRVASVATVLRLGLSTEQQLHTIRAPFLCCIAEREMVLGPASREAQERLMHVAATPPERRSLKRYDALHGILCEPLAKRTAIVDDIVSWLRASVAAGPPTEVSSSSHVA